MAKDKQTFMQQVGGDNFPNFGPLAGFGQEAQPVDEAREAQIKALASGQLTTEQWGVQGASSDAVNGLWNDIHLQKNPQKRAAAQAKYDQALAELQAHYKPEQEKINAALAGIDESKLGLVDTANLPYRKRLAAEEQNAQLRASAREQAIREAIRPPTPEEEYKSRLAPELKFLADAPVADKKTGARGAGGDVGALANELTKYAEAGVNFANKAGGNPAQIQRMSADLARYGVNSLSEIAAYSVPDASGKGTKDVFYNTRTGNIIPTEFGSSMKGKGGSTFTLRKVGDRAIPMPSWKDTSELKDYAPLLMVAGIAAAPLMAAAAGAIGSGIMSAAGIQAGTTAATIAQGIGTAAVQGTVSGGLSALSGGDFGKGFLTGAVGSGIGSVVQAYNPGAFITSNATIGNAINKAIAGGLSGAAGAAITGTDTSGNALRGVIGGAASGLMAPYVGEQIGNFAGKYLAGYVAPNTPAAATAGGARAPVQAPAVGAAAPQPQGLLASAAYGQSPQFAVRRGIA